MISSGFYRVEKPKPNSQISRKLSMKATILQSAVLRTKVHHRPTPTLFSFPGIRGIPIWPAAAFEKHTAALQANFDAILREYQTMAGLKASDYGIQGDEHKLHDGKWDWHSYVMKGRRQADFAVHCPTTTEVLESFKTPRLMTGTPFSFSFFSTLHPEAKIAHHSAACNLRVRCHFPLVVPSGSTVDECGMRVAGERIQWKADEPVYFDDAFDHEVWNSTTQRRVVLLFDLWHPDLQEEEIAAIEEMFEDARQKGWLK